MPVVVPQHETGGVLPLAEVRRVTGPYRTQDPTPINRPFINADQHVKCRACNGTVVVAKRDIWAGEPRSGEPFTHVDGRQVHDADEMKCPHCEQRFYDFAADGYTV